VYIDKYFSRYPDVKAYMDDTRKSSSERGYVETLFGRRLYLPEINSSNGMRRQAAERTAINAPMQGTAADIIKLAMIEVDSWLSKEGLSSRMIMQVHDELVLEVPEVEEGIIREGLVKLMTGVVNLNIPLLVDLGSGANWDEAH
jgi:DNA polymerase-1